MTKNEAIQKAFRLEAANTKLENTLKVIHTWASFDIAEGRHNALEPEHVVALCNKALGRKQ